MSTALKWKLVVGFLLVFIAGGMTGSFISGSRTRHAFRSGALAQRMGQHLRSELGLTPDQFEKLSPIVNQTASNLETIRSETARRVRQTMVESRRQMTPLLTAEQQAKLAAIDQKRRLHARHPDSSPPPPDQPSP